MCPFFPNPDSNPNPNPNLCAGLHPGIARYVKGKLGLEPLLCVPLAVLDPQAQLRLKPCPACLASSRKGPSMLPYPNPNPNPDPSPHRRTKGDLNFLTACKKKAKIHQGSVNHTSGSRFTRTCLSAQPEFLVFSEVVRTPSVYLMNCTTPVRGGVGLGSESGLG